MPLPPSLSPDQFTPGEVEVIRWPPTETRFSSVGNVVENDPGGGGTMASTVTSNGFDGVLVPLASVSVAVNTWVVTVKPLSRMFQLPLASAWAEPAAVVPSNRLTVLLASAVPLNVIAVAVVWPSPTGAVSGEKLLIVGRGGGPGGGGVPPSLT